MSFTERFGYAHLTLTLALMYVSVDNGLAMSKMMGMMNMTLELVPSFTYEKLSSSSVCTALARMTSRRFWS
jgi:hypothetical protein